MGRSRGLVVGGLGLATVLAVGLASVQSAPKSSYKVESPETSFLPARFQFEGRVQRRVNAEAIAAVSGRLEAWRVPDGALVKAGQPVAVVSIEGPPTSASPVQTDRFVPVRPFVDRDLRRESEAARAAHARLNALEIERKAPRPADSTAVAAAERGVSDAKRDLSDLQSRMKDRANQLEAEVAAAELSLSKIQAEHDRIKSLIEMGAVAENRLDPLVAKLASAKERLAEARSVVGRDSSPELEAAQRALKSAESKLERARGHGGSDIDDEVAALRREIERLDSQPDPKDATVEVQPVWGSPMTAPLRGRMLARRQVLLLAPSAGRLARKFAEGSPFPAETALFEIHDPRVRVAMLTVDRSTARMLSAATRLGPCGAPWYTRARVRSWTADASMDRTTAEVEIGVSGTPGSAVRLEALGAASRQALFIPTAALDGDRLTLADGTIRVVTVGRTLGNKAEILGGLGANDTFRVRQL